MATLSATHYNAPLRQIYQRLLSHGKAKKVALVACARKLLVWLNAMVRDGLAWTPTLATQGPATAGSTSTTKTPVNR